MLRAVVVSQSHCAMRGFAWDAYARVWVEITVLDPCVRVRDLISHGAARVSYEAGECRVWLVAYVSDANTIDIIRRCMRDEGFIRATERDVSKLPLHEAAELAVRMSLGRGVMNWTQRMSAEEYRRMVDRRCGSSSTPAHVRCWQKS